MRLVDMHVSTSRQSLGLNPDLQSLEVTQAKRTERISYATVPPGQTLTDSQGGQYFENLQ